MLVPHSGCVTGADGLGRLGHIDTLASVPEDLFQDRRWVSLPARADFWSIGEYAVERMGRALMREKEQLGTEVIGDAVGGSRFNRNSLQAVKDAFDEHHLRPSMVNHFNYLVVRGGRKDPAVYTLIGFPESPTSGLLSITASGMNKLIVDGLIAEADRTLRVIEEQLGLEDSSRSDPARTAATQSRLARVDASPIEQAVPYTVHAPADQPATNRDGWPAWFKRNWRDHTARFVGAVLAGLAVAALVAWFGFSQG